MVTRLIKEQDLFGQPVILTYKGDTEHKTFCGGCVSVLLLLTTIAYFGIGIANQVLNPTFDFSVENDYLQYNNDTKPFRLSTED